MVAGGAAPAAAAPAAATSVVVRLANAVTEADVDDESEYNEIKEDMCASPSVVSDSMEWRIGSSMLMESRIVQK